MNKKSASEINRNIKESKALTDYQKSILTDLLLSMEEVYNELRTDDSIVRISEVTTVFIDIMSRFGFIE